MKKNLLKYLYISCFFIFSLILNGKIMLDQNDELEMPLPLPYDRVIYTINDLNKFIEETINAKKQPIIIFGANWCPDCRIFSGTINIPKVKSYIDNYFEILYVDVQRYEINMSLMEEYGIPSQEGIPRVLVFNYEKELINNTTTAEWRTARDRTSQEIFDFFQKVTVNLK